MTETDELLYRRFVGGVGLTALCLRLKEKSKRKAFFDNKEGPQ